MLKKIICLLLVLLTLSFTLVSCKKNVDTSMYDGDGDAYVFNPYDNIFKKPVTEGDPISVSGKRFYFKDIDIRDKDSSKQVTAENSLKKLYHQTNVDFTAENKVVFECGEAFSMPETEGVREGNVLTVKHTNSDGRTYDVRIEIHEKEICVIHDGHTYNNPGMYAMITFEYLE